MSKSLTEQLLEARQRVEDLSRQLREEMRKGSIVYITGPDGCDECEKIGTLAKITRVDVEDEELPIEVDGVWYPLTSIIKVSSATHARELLYAEADRRIAEYFPEGDV